MSRPPAPPKHARDCTVGNDALGCNCKPQPAPDPLREAAQALDSYDFFMRGLLVGQDRLAGIHRREIAKVRAALEANRCTSDDPSNHQGDTCPVHEAL